MAVLDFLFDKEKNEQDFDMPEGGNLNPYGMVGKVAGRVCWSFNTTIDFSNHLDKFPNDQNTNWIKNEMGNSGWFQYFIFSEELGKEMLEYANKELGKETYLNKTFALFVQRDSVLTFKDEEARNKWPDVIVKSVPMKNFRSPKDYYKFNLLFLPSLIAAGTGNEWDVSHLLGKPEELATDDADKNEDGSFKPHVKKYDDEHKELLVGSNRDWANSLYGYERAKLWSALGEENATVTTSKGNDSELSTALKQLANGWSGTHWVKVVDVHDLVGYQKADGSTGYARLPLVTKFYRNENEAMEDVNKRNQNGGENKVVNNNGSNGNGVQSNDELAKLKAYVLGEITIDESKPKPIRDKLIKEDALNFIKSQMSDEDLMKGYGLNLKQLEDSWNDIPVVTG